MISRREDDLKIQSGLRGFFSYVFSLMSIGILGSFAVSAVLSELFIIPLLKSYGQTVIIALVLISCITTFVVDMFNLNNIQNRSTKKSLVLFFTSAALTSVVLSQYYIFAKLCNAEIILQSLIGTSLIFVSLSVFSYVSKKDFTTLDSILFNCLFVLIFMFFIKFFISFFNPVLASKINLFCIMIGVILSSMFILRHVSMMKNIYYQHSGNHVMLSRLGVMGALMLFHEFISLFTLITHLLISASNRKK